MKKEEFKVGQIIIYNSNWYSKHKDNKKVQKIIRIAGDYIYTDLNPHAGFLYDSYYATQCTLVEDVFILPEKWCIKGDNGEISRKVVNWFKKEIGFTHYKGNGSTLVFYYIDHISKNLVCESILKDYTEITTEQFIKYVLKENIEMKKEKILIGYKLLKDTPDSLAGTIVRTDGRYISKKVHDYHYSNDDLQDPKWFEPIYEKSKIMIGNSEVKILTKDVVSIDDIKYTKSDLVKLLNDIDKQMSNA